MTTHENLAVQYHQQDTDYYCGGACAQMVLQQIGAGLLDQDDLYADNHSHSTAEAGWASGPDGLTWTLNDRRPAGFTNYFALFELTSEDALSRKLCWTIHHYQVAPVALVFGSAHWIAVRGYTASDAPAASSDTSYTISSFDVNNPWPPTPSPAPPPPHAAADACGSGGDRGVADENVSYATWQDTYMTGVPSGHWSGKFVAVCDPEPPARELGPQRRQKPLHDGRTLLAPKLAAKAALAGLAEHGVAARPLWRKLLEATKPADPVLVQRLDRPDSYYYVVPLRTPKARVPALLAVDARTGLYRQSIALPGGRDVAEWVLDRAAAAKLVANRRFEFPSREGRLLVRPEAMCVYPTLVWRPCKESLSPYWPFWMITFGAHRLYVRVDGRVFTSLDVDVRGI